ncbi:MAG TPA: hypothetical protein VHU88_16105 [Sporichthyaceae bacterium]|nr:hypothetical protein [Sporichthyaceae bacterium]
MEATDADLFRALASEGPREARADPPWLRAAALGPTAWLGSYALLPLAKVYQPIWKYDARTLGKDLSAHLVFGAATGTAFAALTHRHTAGVR